jgi:hypothetical protein
MHGSRSGQCPLWDIGDVQGTTADGSLRKDGRHDDWFAWSAMFIADFTKSPAMCEAAKAAKDTYNPRFIDALVHANVCPGLS